MKNTLTESKVLKTVEQNIKLKNRNVGLLERNKILTAKNKTLRQEVKYNKEDYKFMVNTFGSLVRCMNPNDIDFADSLSHPDTAKKVQELMFYMSEYLIERNHMKKSDLLIR